MKQFKKTVLETALNEEITEHLEREKDEKTEGVRASNSQNGTTSETVLTDSVGAVEIEVPRDRGHVRTGNREEAAASIE